jgi:hypothetical protein
MSLVYDDYGRPYVIIREQGSKSRLKGLDAQKVRVRCGRGFPWVECRRPLPTWVRRAPLGLQHVVKFANGLGTATYKDGGLVALHDWLPCPRRRLLQANILAARTVSNILRTSLGPKGALLPGSSCSLAGPLLRPHPL